MEKHNCNPVFTLGCACKGPLSIDQFITEIPKMFEEAEAGKKGNGSRLIKLSQA